MAHRPESRPDALRASTVLGWFLAGFCVLMLLAVVVSLH